MIELKTRGPRSRWRQVQHRGAVRKARGGNDLPAWTITRKHHVEGQFCVSLDLNLKRPSGAEGKASDTFTAHMYCLAAVHAITNAGFVYHSTEHTGGVYGAITAGLASARAAK